MTFLKGQNNKDKEPSQVALVVKNPPTNAGDKRYRVQSLGQEDLLKEEMANHSSILAWRVPWTEEMVSSQGQ